MTAQRSPPRVASRCSIRYSPAASFGGVPGGGSIFSNLSPSCREMPSVRVPTKTVPSGPAATQCAMPSQPSAVVIGVNVAVGPLDSTLLSRPPSAAIQMRPSLSSHIELGSCRPISGAITLRMTPGQSRLTAVEVPTHRPPSMSSASANTPSPTVATGLNESPLQRCRPKKSLPTQSLPAESSKRIVKPWGALPATGRSPASS